MIKLTNVTKYFQTPYGKKYILKDISLTIPENLNIGILGRNGAGKSTLMRMLGNIEFPNQGKISSNKTFSWPLGLSAGFVGNMTGRANIRFVCRLYNRSEKETKEIIAYVKDFSELDNYFDMPIKTYSSGMRGKLNFGLSLAFNFDYMLIDETLSVGDIRFRLKAKEALLQKIQSSNALVVSHNTGTLREICDAGIVVDEGQLYYYNDIADAITEYVNINKKAG